MPAGADRGSVQLAGHGGFLDVLSVRGVFSCLTWKPQPRKEHTCPGRQLTSRQEESLWGRGAGRWSAAELTRLCFLQTILSAGFGSTNQTKPKDF